MTDTTPHTEEQPPSTVPTPLREHDYVEHDQRSVTFVWTLGEDPEGGVRQAILTVSHHNDRPTGRFSAWLLNRSEEKTDFGLEQRMGPVNDWQIIASFPVARYSAARLKTASQDALTRLRTLANAGHEKTLVYFAPTVEAEETSASDESDGQPTPSAQGADGQ
jgi:hypothetical protein